MGRARLWRVAAVVYTALILFLLWSPSSGKPPLFPHDDKIVHCLAFCGIGASWWWATRRVSAVWSIGVALAVGSEVVQGMLPWPRFMDVLDMLADVTGVAIGLAFARKWSRRTDAPSKTKK